MATMLEVKNLTKKFGKLTAVDDVTFDVKKGEVFSLIGPNGSGKTTIVKIVVGLLRATNGNIRINNFDIKTEPTYAKAQIGYIPDEPNVWENLTGEEFLNLVGMLFDLDEDAIKSKIKTLLKIYNLEGIEKGYFQNYSRGNKQKFTILASLLHNPKILIIDEPIIGLDPKSIAKTKQELKKYTKNGGTVFMVTHMLDVAEDIADRIGILKQGKIIEVGTLSELRSKSKSGSDTSLEDVYLKFT